MPFAAAAPLVLALLAPLPGPAPAPQDDPLTRPIEAEYAARWLAPQAPRRVHGNSYLVGFAGLNVALIETPAGLILIDGAVPQGVAAIEANIRALGFQLRDVKLILSTEPHWDHAGGLAALARDTGATVVASAQAARTLRDGIADPHDPQHGQLSPFPTVPRLRAVGDGEVLRLGGVAVTAHATPGHTAGSMSWSWRACAAQRCRTLVFASSINPVSAEGYRFSDPSNAAVLRSYRATFARFRALPCDILLTAHPDQRAGSGARLDPRPCATYADKHARLLDAKLASEAKR